MNSRHIYQFVLTAAAFVVLLLAIPGCTEPDEREPGTKTGITNLQAQGRWMPSFTLPFPLAEGPAFSSDALAGKVVLVSFFASWCRSCLEEIPLLKKMQKKFGEENFTILAIALDRENDWALKILFKNKR
jgi:thiol-disulfide isomerase/thioredoxin